MSDNPVRTPLATIMARHDLTTVAGFAACMSDALATYDREVLDEPRNAAGDEVQAACPTGDDYNELMDIIETLALRAGPVAERPPPADFNDLAKQLGILVPSESSPSRIIPLDDKHWLSGINAIFAADTGDLRKLATLAGEDPATLYIGTSLDGCDLRDQDLTGMHLPGLNPRKVRHNRKTIFPDGSRGGLFRRATKNPGKPLEA